MVRGQGRICKILTCPEPVNARGWCKLHYERNRKFGDPRADVPLRTGHFSVYEYVLANYLDPEAHSVWPYSCTGEGYGMFSMPDGKGGKRFERAHALACTLAHGPRPDGMIAAHTHASPRSCFYADHLQWGTQSKNAGADRERDGTLLRGSANPQTKLTEAAVRQIRLAREAGATFSQIAAEYGVDPSNVFYIVQRKSWRWVV